MTLMTGAHFDGATYSPELDHARLTGQIRRVYDLMADGRWRTLRDIEDATGDPQASVSARLRDLRKDRFGAFVINRRREGNQYQYQLATPEPDGQWGLF